MAWQSRLLSRLWEDVNVQSSGVKHHDQANIIVKLSVGPTAAVGVGEVTDWADWLTVGGLARLRVAAERAEASTVLELVVSCWAKADAAVCVLLYWEAGGNSTCARYRS